jgi:hypothetical protein
MYSTFKNLICMSLIIIHSIKKSLVISNYIFECITVDKSKTHALKYLQKYLILNDNLMTI